MENEGTDGTSLPGWKHAEEHEPVDFALAARNDHAFDHSAVSPPMLAPET